MKQALLHILLGLSILFTCCWISTGSANAQTTDSDNRRTLADSTAKATGPAATASAYTQPKNIEEYLNQISNPSLPRTIRKKWKEEALRQFANSAVQVLDIKDGLGNRYTAAALLNLLVDFPHQVKVSEVLRNQQDKITELHLKLDRQTK